MNNRVRRRGAIGSALAKGFLEVVVLAGCASPAGHDGGADAAAEAGGDAVALAPDASDGAATDATVADAAGFVSTPCDAGASGALCFASCYVSEDMCDGIPAGVYPCNVQCGADGACAGSLPDAAIAACSLTGFPDGGYQVHCIQC